MSGSAAMLVSCGTAVSNALAPSPAVDGGCRGSLPLGALGFDHGEVDCMRYTCEVQ